MTSTLAALDYLLYYDEDQDIDENEMTEYSPVEAAHVRELVERGLLLSGEVFSHKGWHHCLYTDGEVWWGSMWDGPTGEERRYLDRYNEWEI
jgi:hypothetical protein